MANSMTGFARQEQQHPWGTITCEIRSVNHRYLEPHFRLPDVLRAFEPAIREKLKAKLSRGKVEISIQLGFESSKSEQLSLNEDLAKTIADMAQSVAKHLDNPAAIDPVSILNWPGILASKNVDSDTLKSAALAIFDTALEHHIAHRAREGEAMQTMISERVNGISQHVATVRQALPAILQLHQDKLKAKVSALEIELDHDRFQQEAIFLAQKADVAEELDRLDAHITELKKTLNSHQPIGRRLDFLMQEFNREANTLSSKSLTSETTQIAVDVKVLIEQMREQIQNIE